MKQFIGELFIWWNKQTLGTRWHTFLNGQYVGSDEAGNQYFKGKKGVRRWVVYNGPSDPSAIPPGWHSWMHYRTDVLPSEERYQAKFWELEHEPNQTGTVNAYRPEGSMMRGGERARVTGDYEAWSPE